MTDHSRCVDEHGGAIRDAGALQVQSVGAGDFALGVEIRQEREGDTAEILRPVEVAVDAVDADTQDLGVGSPEARQERLHARDLHASGGGVVEGIEEQQHVPPPFELRERDLALELILQTEPGSLLACFDHGRLLDFDSDSFSSAGNKEALESRPARGQGDR